MSFKQPRVVLTLGEPIAMSESPVYERIGSRMDELQLNEECERCLSWSKAELWVEAEYVVYLMRLLEGLLHERYPDSLLHFGTVIIPVVFVPNIEQDIEAALQAAVGKKVGADRVLPCVCLWHRARVLNPWSIECLQAFDSQFFDHIRQLDVLALPATFNGHTSLVIVRQPFAEDPKKQLHPAHGQLAWR
jgi:hypothetical protein